LTVSDYFSRFTIVVVDGSETREALVKRKPRLTVVEWEIMEAIWTLGGSPAVRDVLDHAFPRGEKAYTTVQTIMNTLVGKGYLVRKKTGMVNFYTPSKNRGQMVRKETSSLLSRVFHGSVPAMTSHLLKSEGLTLEEIKGIRELLDARARKLRRKKP
jgi:predicted transcriptional regulator